MEQVVRKTRQRARPYWMPLSALVLLFAMVLLVAGVIQYPRQPAHAASADWSMFLGNNARTGYNSNESSINPTTASSLKVKWTYPTGSRMNAQPVVASGQVYIGSWNGQEYATDLSGKKLWSASIGGQSANCSPPDVFGVGSTPSINTVTINQTSTLVAFVGGKDPTSKVASLYALNAADGTTIWETPLSTTGNNFVWSSPVLYNGSVYVGLSSVNDCPLIRGALVQLDAATGAIQHTFYTVPSGCIGASIWGSPAINDATGKIFVTTGNNGQCSSTETYAQAIIELNTSDLSYVDSWQVPASQHRVDSDFGATPTLFTTSIGGNPHKMVGVVNKNGTYYALDQDSIHTGPVWMQPISTSTISISSSAWDGSMLYVAGRNTTIGGKACTGSIRALNPSTGAFAWQVCLNDGNVLAPVSAVPGVVFVGEGAHIVAIDTASGNILFNYKTSNTIDSGPSIANGSLYVGNNNGTLYAFGVPNAPTPTPSPSVTASVTASPGITPSTTPGTTLAQDTFLRPNQSLWGTASDGQSWGADANTLSTFSISANSGQVLGSGTSARSYNAVLGPSATDAEVLFSGSVSSYGGNTLGATLRWTDSNHFYRAFINGKTLTVVKKVGGPLTTLGSVPFAAKTGTVYSIRFRVIGSTLTAKVWASGTSEPSGWMVTASDSTLTAGHCGVLVYLANAITADVTAFQATSAS
ncbi:MAG: PQQ-binding-like beta-propeller repeat protein [Ktedonobacteraceae bacterium]